MSFRLQQTFISLLLLLSLNVSSRAQDTVATLRAEYAPVRFSGSQLIAPGLLIGSGFAVSGGIKNQVRDWRNEHLSSFHTRLDDVLALSPVAAVYVMDWAGVPAKTDFLNRSAILAKAELLCLVSVYGLKYSAKEMRPDGSDMRSFPSSHTAQAFLAATLLSEEYKGRFPWMPYVAYTLASGVGAMRVANNRHYLNDVLIGAGIGILSQKFAYWTHRYRWGARRKKVTVVDF